MKEAAAMESKTAATLTPIIVPLDGSENAEAALPYVRAIGGPAGEVTLLEVTPPASNVRNIFGKEIGSAQQVQQGYEKVAQEHLDRAAARLGDQARVRREVAVGDPAEQILRVASEQGAGLIAMTSQGRGAWGPWALGSTIDRVVRAARQPVLVVHPRAAATGTAGGNVVTGLLVPIDGSDEAARALPVAAALARALAVPVRVVRAVSAAAVTPPGQSAYDQEALAAQRTEAQRGVQTAVDGLRATGVEATAEVLTGEPVATVISAADPGDLIVVTSHGQTGSGRWVLGGVADKLVRAGTTPAVLVPSAMRVVSR
jgi:nucleotide-binding universal stress UspA family protein